MAGLHTHDDTGTIHNEGQADATLGQFFAIWGVPFSRDRLGPYRAGRDGVVQMWVDGRPSTAWESLKLVALAVAAAVFSVAVTLVERGWRLKP
jgi:hypothetical protein